MQSINSNKKLLYLAFIAGPLLMLTGSIFFVLGVGISPDQKSSYVEGIFGCYGIVLFIPIYWEMSRTLATKKKVLATITLITGLLGPTTGFTHMYGRIYEHALRSHGASDQLWQSFYTNPGGELLSVALLGPLFPLTSILLGIGFLLTKKIPMWMSLGLIAAGILFPAAVISESDVLLHSAYPLACFTWTIVFTCYAIRYLLPAPSYQNS